MDCDTARMGALPRAIGSLSKIVLLGIAGLFLVNGTPAVAQTAGVVEVYEGKYFYPTTEPYSRIEDMGLVISRKGTDLSGKFKVPVTWNKFGNPGGEMDLYLLEISGNTIRLNATGMNGERMEIEGSITSEKITGTMVYRGYSMKVDLRRVK